MSSLGIFVKLNVGGTVFETSKSTLTRFDGFFKTMLQSDVPTAKNQENCIFVDRDPTYFRYVLNFMRDGTVKLPISQETVQEILVEANFYLLEGLVELCKQKLEGTVNRLDIPNTLRILETYDQVLQLTTSSMKPVLIIYYCLTDGVFTYPDDFDLKVFMEKIQDQIEIYFNEFPFSIDTETSKCFRK